MRKGNGFWPVAAWIFPIFPALGFYWNRWDLLLSPNGAAKFFGFLGLFYFLNALILSTRIKYFDLLYGNGRVLTFRSITAVAALILMLVHRQLKLADGQLVHTGQILFGRIALIILISSIVITAIFTDRNPVRRLTISRRIGAWWNSRNKKDYSKLRVMHNLPALAGIAVAIHVILSVTSTGFRMQMIIPVLYLLCALWFYIRFRIIRPAQLRRSCYTVSEIRQPGGMITEVRMTGDPFNFKAGQYAYWRIFSGAVGREEHPFTISSPPGDQEIGFSANASSHYGSALRKVRVGDKAVIDGPYGRFTLPGDESIPLLLIAGDIGISPFMSMLQDMANKHSMRHATLIWAVKCREDLVYGAELLNLAKRLPSFRYKPVINEHLEMQGDGTLADFEGGEITKGLIRGLFPDLKDDKTLVYICAPDPMRTNLNKILRSIAVPRGRVMQENFNLV